ncbi:MAG: UDP-N-acetylmuramate dehydrogenase [Limisphaerales bacterium]
MSIPREDIALALKPLVSAQTLFRQNEPLAKKTTLRVGGAADFYLEPVCEEELAKVFRFCREHAVPVMVLGRGSNLLIRDGGIRGVVISLAHANFSNIEVTGDHTLRCGAGTKLKQVAVEARRNQLSGFEFLEGIPGSVGGALRMNAGAMGSAMFDLVESIRVMDPCGGITEFKRDEIQVHYRSCPLLKQSIALGAVLKGQPAAADLVAAKMKQFSHKRWDSQPAQPSAGCIFKNPTTIPAGKLVDELGMKGTRIGGAMVSEIHGNFIVNDSGASAKDVLELIASIKKRARETRGIELETEVEIVGED